jgi:crotonobetainyl-CoA:carnitine CoA-transferase CaiB-like acyl-CoA transferase
MAANEEPAHDRGSRPGALSGIRVIELADELAEYCGLTLAGLGADVVKVEPPGGSPTRHIMVGVSRSYLGSSRREGSPGLTAD